MKIPDRLGKLLERDQGLDGAVKSAIARFEPWIKHSHLPFFPEYTDHGLDHLEQILATASSLIRDEAWTVLTPADASVLILAVLLHDSAMHLSEHGFVALLNEPWRSRTLNDMSDTDWHVVWEEFLGEASRFDGRKLMALFGDTHQVRRPSLDPKALTQRDRLLIGEFLRRHHPRLAQEIAEYGVPGPNPSQPLVLGESAPIELFQLAGLVARSHGVEIRRFLPILETRYGKGGHREFRGVHASFLMVLVRIADYLQVQAERAPKQVLAIKKLASPVSQKEWRAHDAILDVRQTNDDPEALHIEARPSDVETFFRIQDWGTGIQHELDESWAVLGEVYGRFSGLAPLGIVIRRIRSNLDDVPTLSKSLDFIPQRAAFRAADADLIKLLIGPLYGDSPAIGMRELIQNAIDAVRELDVLLEDRGQKRSEIDLTRQSADVIASIEKDEKGQHWVTVSDCGIGMTPEVIIKYFLTAGASFRRSDDWRKSFETEDGKSKVLRAGRFGIGALAAFLLGSEIHVSTRHVDAADGVCFTATVETEFVELKKAALTVGTTIRIPVDEHTAEKLAKPRDRFEFDGEKFDWDWYCSTSPSLDRVVFGSKLEQKHAIQDSATAIDGWRHITHPEYDGIFWTYAEAPQVVCNGIIVRKGTVSAEDDWALDTPNVWIRDPDGNLPLNLQRSELRDSAVTFQSELGVDIARSFCAFALSRLPSISANILATTKSLQEVRSPHLKGYNRSETNEWFVTQDGIGFAHPQLVFEAKCERLLISSFVDYPDDSRILHQPIGVRTAYLAEEGNASVLRLDGWLRQLLDLMADETTAPHSVSVWSLLGRSARVGTRVLVSDAAVQRCKTGKIAKSVWRATSIEWELNGWCLLRSGDCIDPQFPFRELASEHAPRVRTDSIAECYLDRSRPPAASPLVDEWLRVFGQPLIPFDLELRKKRLGRAYELLASYL